MTRPPAVPKRFRSLALGFALGFLVGSAGVASAAFGRAGWDRFGLLFKQGYVAGFIDCVRIAKAIDPFSYIATNFPAPPRAKPIVWVRTIDELYAKDEHKDRTLAQILIIAGTKLEKDFGDDELKAGDQRLEALRQAIDRQRKALLQARKTVEAAQGELAKPDAAKPDAAKPSGDAVDKSGAGTTEKPSSEAETGGSTSNADNAAEKDAAEGPTIEHEQAPPTPEGLRRGVVPEGSHGPFVMPGGPQADIPIQRPQAENPAPSNQGQE